MSTSAEGGDSIDQMSENNSDRAQPSFANALKYARAKVSFPEREQAIVFDTLDNTVKDDYIVGVGKLIGPKNIIFASRVSNNRVCIYLSSKKMVETFIAVHEGITINDEFVRARRLVSPAKRVILSNVSPCIPHEAIEYELKRLKLKTVSHITFIGAGLVNPEYKHILSFRRQVYIILDEKEQLPESILILHKQNYFRIFISTDELRCFSCKKLGHVAQKCPDNEKNTAAETTVEKEDAQKQPVTDNNVVVTTAEVHAEINDYIQGNDSNIVINREKEQSQLHNTEVSNTLESPNQKKTSRAFLDRI